MNIRATFKCTLDTDARRFRAAVRAVYNGEAQDEDVAYVLDHTQEVTCGHDPADAKRAGQTGGRGRPRKA